MDENILALPQGTPLNHYVIESVLGQGGFGVVYKAHHAHLKEQVVIKEFLPVELASRQGTTVIPHGSSKQDVYSDCLRRFMEEGRTLVKLRHQNVVRCRDLFTANGTAYLVMDFEDGLALDELILSLEAQGQRYSQEQLLHFLIPMADGLAYVHQQGVLHRDIKPANVFIRRSDGSPVLIDFGAAKQNFALASQSQAPYSDFYAPMEQIEGTGEAKPTVDIHAFGALMYRIVTGTGGIKAESRILAIVSGREDPLKAATSFTDLGYSAKLLSLIDDCLKFKPLERPQTMQEVKARLLASVEVDGSDVKGQDNPLSRLEDMLELAGSDGVISETEMALLISKGISFGADESTVRQYVVEEATRNGWRLELAGSGGNKGRSTAQTDRTEDVSADTVSKDINHSLAYSLENSASENVVDINFSKIVSCETCLAAGAVNSSCATCAGKGLQEKNQTLRVKIPQGVMTADRIRLRGEGNVTEFGQSSGDLYIVIAIEPHPVFTIHGQDLHASIAVDEKDLFSGNQIPFNAIDRQFKLKVPEGYKKGQAIRLNGIGLPFGGETHLRGSLFLTLEPKKANKSKTTNDGAIVIVLERNCPAIKSGVLQENIGIETLGSTLTPLVSKGTNLMNPVAQTFSTSEDNQTVVSLNMYRGNSTTLSKGIFLGTFDISDISTAQKGIPKIEVSVFCENNDVFLKVKSLDGDKLRLTSENPVSAQTIKSQSAKSATHQAPPDATGNEDDDKKFTKWGIFWRVLIWVVFVLIAKTLISVAIN
ncbi:DnaJ C-terminal domain-containing protein [Aliiglaciecola sp. 3_MG-2023]|uniref:protein kinase domain-containing protein n=1 Tax=Aliiglaciecola sp. 3_MG-2023 TaxID=3062644 RepID=UPI0026E45062|nr:DnaJ C-terminal domain-containing protein [Aliiglaciecola sp. 3_MG-2023]MDO6695381.1 DnaJ C-terminal domain-containing protein [Aliiglaciecola sp. 3_MG-2023]